MDHQGSQREGRHDHKHDKHKETEKQQTTNERAQKETTETKQSENRPQAQKLRDESRDRKEANLSRKTNHKEWKTTEDKL